MNTCPFCTYLSASLTEERVVKYIKALQKKQNILNENDKSKLKMLENFHEIGRVVGYTTVRLSNGGNANGTVFHCGESWLYTCSHVVKIVDKAVKDTFVLDRQKITFKWIDLGSEKTELHEFTPRCDRIGVFTKIANDEGEIDLTKIDLAIFREDQIARLKLPSISFKSIVDMEFDVKSEGIVPSVPAEVLDSVEKFWREKNEKTFLHVELEEVITSKDVTSSSGDMLYHIYWDFPKSGPIKMFYFKNQIRKKVSGPCFEFDSPAAEGASGSPVMVYRKVYGPEKEFCLVGVMSAGEKYIQLAELPESIKDHSKLTMQINNLHTLLTQYAKLSEMFRRRDNPNNKEWIETTLKEKEEIKKTIRDILQEKGLEVFLGSLCIDIAEPMHDMAA